MQGSRGGGGGRVFTIGIAGVQETSRMNSNLQLRAAEGLEKVYQDAQNLQKRADDLTKSLTGRNRDSTMPLYRGDDSGSE